MKQTQRDAISEYRRKLAVRLRQSVRSPYASGETRYEQSSSFRRDKPASSFCLPQRSKSRAAAQCIHVAKGLHLHAGVVSGLELNGGNNCMALFHLENFRARSVRRAGNVR